MSFLNQKESNFELEYLIYSSQRTRTEYNVESRVGRVLVCRV